MTSRASTAKTRTMHIRNNCFEKIRALVYYDGSVHGWYEVAPGELFEIGDTKDGHAFIYTESASLTWPSGPYPFLFAGKSYNFERWSFTNSGNQFRFLNCDAVKLKRELANTNSQVAAGKAVGLFKDCNYNGSSSALPAGSYDFNKLGIGNDVLSSLKIPKGWSITLYEDATYKNKLVTYNSREIPCLSGAYNDKVSSVLIEDKNPPPADPFSNPGGSTSSKSYDVYIKNDCFQPIKVLLRIQRNLVYPATKWETVGWLSVQPGKEFFADNTTNGIVYYYAEMGGLKWPAAGYTPVNTQGFNGKSYGLARVDFSGYGKKTITISCPAEKEAFERSQTNLQVNSGKGVGLFEECSYGGLSNTISAGKYDMDNVGMKDKKLGSIKVPAGWSIILYEFQNFQGNSETFAEDISCLPYNWRDKVFSIEIINKNPNKTELKPKEETKPVTAPVNNTATTLVNVKTEGLSLNLVADQAFIIPVNSELSNEEAWRRVISVFTPNGFLSDGIDHKLQTYQSKWKAFSRSNNTLRIKVVISKSGTESNLQYDLTFFAEESGEKETPGWDDVKFRSTKLVPKECDKLLADLMRKLGGS